jgi:hypothetical protein
MDQGLWVTTYNKNSYADIAQTISRSLSPDGSNVTVVDVSQTRSVFWPLIRGLAIASPEYREELGRHKPFNYGQSDFKITFAPVRRVSPYWLYDDRKTVSVAVDVCVAFIHQRP